MEMNRITNSTMMREPATSVDGEVLFDLFLDRYTAHLSTTDSARVRTAALDAVESRGDIRPPVFMKIDIESCRV